jgi:hypothetical protein
MIKRNYCGCGGAFRKDGRCTGCGKIVPSSNTIINQIAFKSKEIQKLSDKLRETLKLEAEDREKE